MNSTERKLKRCGRYPKVTRQDVHERWTCCGETFVGLVAAENHAVFEHGVERLLARELIVRSTLEVTGREDLAGLRAVVGWPM